MIQKTKNRGLVKCLALFCISLAITASAEDASEKALQAVLRMASRPLSPVIEKSSAQALAIPQRRQMPTSSHLSADVPTYSSLVEKYYPMNDGDYKDLFFSYHGQTTTKRYSYSRNADSSFTETVGAAGVTSSSSTTYKYQNGELVVAELGDGWDYMTFDPPLVFLKNSALAQGGTFSSHANGDYNGMPFRIAMTVTLSKMASQSVPAGIYYDCRKFSFTMTATVQGRTGQVNGEGLVLAPGIGILRENIMDSGVSYGWANLIGGRVNGMDVSDIILETTPPSVTISSPAKNARLTSSTGTFKGTTTDNVGVTAVYCRLNGGDVLQAEGITNWQFQCELVPGTNTVQVYAADACGNFSKTNTVSCVYVVTAPMGITKDGQGSVTPLYNGAALEVGKTYKITAKPASGQVFQCWTDETGSQWTNGAACSFVMRSNLVLQAHFIPNPFPSLKGSYSGLFYSSEGIAVTNAGLFKMTLTEQGGVTGTLLLEGKTLRFSGAFDFYKKAQLTVPRAGKSPLKLDLTLSDLVIVSQPPGGGVITPLEESTSIIVFAPRVTGTVSGDVWQSDIRAVRSTTMSAGTHTFLFQANSQSTGVPPGDGVASGSVGSGGTLNLVGSLADGETVSQNIAAGVDGFWPVCVPLYGGRGLLFGWVPGNGVIGIPTDLTNSIALETKWIKPAGISGGVFYTNGFSENLLVSHYSMSASSKVSVTWTNGVLSITGGNLPQDSTNKVVLSKGQLKVTESSLMNMTLKLDSKTGLVSGSFKHPVSGRSTPFKGAIIPGPDGISISGGWFRGTNEAGAIRLTSE